ncbi:hypothetical protein B0H14DRAFT_3658919 [Mycena olivaceomarginata]|nr:hypothetical protein B0H14DRAFT_3658919 [Mycena olivaceomarginata]
MASVWPPACGSATKWCSATSVRGAAPKPCFRSGSREKAKRGKPEAWEAYVILAATTIANGASSERCRNWQASNVPLHLFALPAKWQISMANCLHVNQRLHSIDSSHLRPFEVTSMFKSTKWHRKSQIDPQVDASDAITSAVSQRILWSIIAHPILYRSP